MQKAKWEYENFLDSVLETIDLYETDNTFRKLVEPYIKEIQAKKLKFEEERNECRTADLKHYLKLVTQVLNYIQNSGFMKQKFGRQIPFIIFSQIEPQKQARISKHRGKWQGACKGVFRILERKHLQKSFFLYNFRLKTNFIKDKIWHKSLQNNYLSLHLKIMIQK